MSTKRRSNVVAKVLLVTALASGIAGMQALPAHAEDWYSGFFRLSEQNLGIIFAGTSETASVSIRIATNDFTIAVGPNNSSRKYYTIKKGELYLDSSTDGAQESSFSDRWLTVLGDAKSILGSGSSSGLSEEQKTMIKDLIANRPGLCRLVEKFNERNDDNDEYEKT